jgi:uncharacterized metal-binding protein
MSADCKHGVAQLDSPLSGPSASSVVLDLCAARAERLTEQILVQLARHGGAVTRYTADVGDVELWRRAARSAGRVLNVPVRTGVAPDGSKVWVVTES